MFSMKSMKKRILGFSNSEKGFTLIEIIAVLVILGILAAVTIPRFANLQDDARNKAALAGISEAKARLAGEYARILLVSNGDITQATGTLVNTNINTEYGDFVLTFSPGATSVGISVTSVGGVAPNITISDTWIVPHN